MKEQQAGNSTNERRKLPRLTVYSFLHATAALSDPNSAEQPDEIVWAYTYHILLHEYLHSLGFLNERQCRMITHEISKNVFKDPKHPAVVLATKGIGAFFPNLHLIYAPPGYDLRKGLRIERVKDFDRESHQSYFV